MTDAARHHFVLIADPRDRRASLFAQAVQRAGARPPEVVDYRDLLAGPEALVRSLRGPAVVRIETPGRDFEIYRGLLVRGARAAGRAGGPAVDARRAAAMPQDKGRICFPRQWYLGLCRVLRDIESVMADRADVVPANQPGDIAVMFDKGLCHRLLGGAGIGVPCALPPPRCFEELREHMRTLGLARVFVKLAHGSSASGVVAYETAGPRQQATTTVEMVAADGEVRLYNSRRIRRYTRAEDIEPLIDALCAHGVHVEAWVPKAGVDGFVCDLRVLTIAGEPCHTVLRMARGPITNLHLLNRRGDPSALRAKMTPRAWEDLRQTCRAVAGCFPRTLHVGVDVAVGPDYSRHAVLEANAFGDLLNDVLWRGMTTHEAEVAALLGGVVAAQPGGRGQRA